MFVVGDVISWLPTLALCHPALPTIMDVLSGTRGSDKLFILQECLGPGILTIEENSN